MSAPDSAENDAPFHRMKAEAYLRDAESAPVKTADACASIATAHALLAVLDALTTARIIPPAATEDGR